MSYGRQMKVKRKELDITAKELADMIGVAESTLFSYENETRKPNMERMRKIAGALGMTLDDLFKETSGE